MAKTKDDKRGRGSRPGEFGGTRLDPAILDRFLEDLAQCGNVTAAAQTAGVSRPVVYAYRKNDPDFARKWEEAVKIGNEALEDEARRRAYAGYEEPVFYQGKKVATVRRFSDALLQFLLKGSHPEKYKDRVQQEVSGPGGGPVQVDLSNLSTEELRVLKSLTEKAKVEKQ